MKGLTLQDLIHKVHEDMEGRYDLTGEDLYYIHSELCRLQPSQFREEPQKPDFQKLAQDLMSKYKNGSTKILGHDWSVPCLDHYALLKVLEDLWNTYVVKQPTETKLK